MKIGLKIGFNIITFLNVLYEDKPFATFIVRLFNGEKVWFRVNMTEKMGNLRALIDKHYPAPG